jgi:nucleotide-binding universal stress UspA family protein
VTVLHVIEDEYEDEQAEMRIEENLRRNVRNLFHEPAGKADVRITKGKAFLEIIRQARRQSAELTVVGAHGEEYIKDLLIGTTAEKIVRKGDRPVLIVRRQAREPYRRILIAVDFSDTSRDALQFALRVAPRAQVRVLHVCLGLEAQLTRAGLPSSEIVRYRRRATNVARGQLDRFLAKIDCGGRAIRREVVTGRARHEIVRFAQSIHPDLIVVGTAGRTNLPYILLGSVAEHVMREASCDVLVVRRNRAHFRLP